MMVATDDEDDGDADHQLRDARERSAASREILEALGRDVANPGAVLDTVVEKAAQLCGARAAQLFRRDGDVFRLSRATRDTPDDYRMHLMQQPIAMDRSSTVGRAAEDKCTVQIPDVLADLDYGRSDLQTATGFRTLLSTPMLLEDRVVGVLSMWRTDVAPFDDRERALLEDFAVQGAIVMQQVNLVRALESRRAELGNKVAQLEALQEVDDAVGSSLDVNEVLERIVRNAVRLTNLGFGDITLSTDGGSILEYDVTSDSFHVHAFGSSADLLQQLRAITIRREESTLAGRTAHAHEPFEIPNLADVDRDRYLEVLFRNGWRSVLAVPMLRGETMLGVLVIRRRGTGNFPRDVTEVLQTFAGQSALAIVNARLFRALETKSRELEIASNHKSEFLANMSHELRTPLNAVIGFSKVLLERSHGELNERQDQYLHDIWNSGRHLLELLNDILDLSRIESGQMDVEPRRFSVSGALEYTLATVRERAAAHSIVVTVEIADDIGMIDADELRFKQVVVNLLSNAVKFTPDGGSVTLCAYRAGTELNVTVTDTGIGVAPEHRGRIFESFQQGRRGASKGEGTGLGLTLSRKFVGLMGGRMWLESAVGEGSTFGFAIPVLPQGGDGIVPAAVGELPVLILVDDDRASLDLISAYLDGSRVQVLCATDGVQALDLIRRVLPTAVVLDIKLPRRDGWDVLAELKAAPETAAIPVVIATVLDERARALAAGAAVFLRKPVGRDELVDALLGVNIPVGKVD
jgi:signal transduction histidine kinase